MLNKRPSKLCGICKGDDNCKCECHNSNLVLGRHFEIHIDDMEYNVKPITDLDNFR